jgi:hypothetical protein
MKPVVSNSPDLILRSLAERSEAGRLEGWRLARTSPAAILLKAMQGIVRRRIACAMLLGMRLGRMPIRTSESLTWEIDVWPKTVRRWLKVGAPARRAD